MNSIEKRKDYIRNIYSKQWSSKRKEYGIIQFDKELIQKILTKKKGKILEVGIGDGFPYSSKLDKMEFEVYGIDLSPKHVDMVKESLPNINVKVGDSENLDFKDDMFDVVFCFRSTWYFPNLTKSINEMLRVRKQDGLVIFDIQNSKHPIHINYVKESQRIQNENNLKHILIKYLKNILKILLRPFKFYYTDWSLKKPIDIVTSTNPDLIDSFLKNRNDVKFRIYGVNWDSTPSLQEIKSPENYNQFDRLVYEIINTNSK
ncbi:class I SAM-dependent methyltransferase [Flavobacteriaceae bacterium]|nr:class I SAM-dependent methyltransferase [Flavobacteriaceae bacterium]